MYLQCDHVNKEIKGVEILRDISFRMQGGRVYGLWGKNGCGKTMLMRVISGLIKPTSGTVDVDGRILWKDGTFPESMGIMIENPSFLPEYTGFDNLKLLASIRGKTPDSAIRTALFQCGLDPDDERKYRKYSLGMKQRLGIACAIMENPRLVILDEPINALDEGGVRQIREIMQELKERGTLVVIACHDQDEMKILADEVYLMAEGSIYRKEVIHSE